VLDAHGGFTPRRHRTGTCWFGPRLRVCGLPNLPFSQVGRREKGRSRLLAQRDSFPLPILRVSFWAGSCLRLPALGVSSAGTSGCGFPALYPAGAVRTSKIRGRWANAKKQGWVLDSLFLLEVYSPKSLVCIILNFGAAGIVGPSVAEVEEVGIPVPRRRCRKGSFT